MTSYSDLLDALDEGFALVLPTEESARSVASDYVLRRGRGLLSSSCIAFDRFASSFLSGIEGRRAAGEAERFIFSLYASDALFGKLGYLAPSDYPEMKSRLPSFFRFLLPMLDEAAAIPKKSRKAAGDFRALFDEYMRFMDDSGLYESAFLSPAVPQSLGRRSILVMPSVFSKEAKVAAASAGCGDISIADDVAAPIPPLSVFRYEKEEIRALFISIRELVESGETLDTIAISVPALDRLRPYLDEEAYLAGIPLDYASGVSPISSAPGRFLSGLSDIHSSGYSLDSLREFMLSPATPFRDRRALRRFIAAAVASSVTSAPSRRDDRYMRLPQACGTEHYRLLRLSLDRLMEEKDPDRILPLLHAITSGLLEEGEFTGNADDAALYSFSLDALSSFLRAASDAASHGYAVRRPLFPAFIEYLSSIRYVPKKRKEGVRVYPFTQDAAVPCRHRFIIALNEGESSRIVKEASSISDYELAAEREEKNITLPLLSLYSAMTSDLRISASYDTYGGAALPLASLLPSSRMASCGDDPWIAETGRQTVSRILPLQLLSYERASAAAFRERKKADDMTAGRKGAERALPVHLSYTSFNAYARCPYLYALQYAFGFREMPQYEPAAMDHLEIGSRLHSILERYYRTGCASPCDDVPRLFEEEMDFWRSGRRFDGGGISDMPSSASRPTEFLIAYLRKRYLGRLVDAVRRMDEISRPLPDGIERGFSIGFPDSGFTLEGRVDRIAEARDGSSLILFDYKKGRRFPKDEVGERSFQFHIYRLLIDAGYGGGKSAEEAYFISLLDGVFTSAAEAPSTEVLQMMLSDTARSIASGDWHALPSDQNCQRCAMRGICRRRFSIR